MAEAPEGPAAEAFRNLRAALSLLGPEAERRPVDHLEQRRQDDLHDGRHHGDAHPGEGRGLAVDRHRADVELLEGEEYEVEHRVVPDEQRPALEALVRHRLQEAAARSTRVGNEEMPDDVRWIRSYVLDEGGASVGMVCVYEATGPEAIRRHAARAGLPVDEIIRVVDTVVMRADPEPVAAQPTKTYPTTRPGPTSSRGLVSIRWAA